MAMASRCGATRATGAARAARAAPPRAVASQPRRAVASAAAKSILFDQESRTKLQAGIDKIADAVGVTLGPRGRNVVLEEKFGNPRVINDGVSIARAIDLADPVENAGAQLIREVAGRTNDSAGDGTTTASVLARSFVKLGLAAVASGANPVNIKRGIDKTAAALVKLLKERARPVDGTDDIRNVATISAGNDPYVGDLIAEAVEKVGTDGVLSIETGSTFETEVEVEEGMEIDRGYISPQFVTNNERLLTEFENCKILVTDEKISDIKQIVPILEEMNKINKQLLIIAEDVTDEALATLVVNKMRGVLNVCAIKAPGFGERRKALLQDIAIVTGAEYVAKDLGMSCEKATGDMLGDARKVTVANNTCMVIANAATKEEIQARVRQIKQELERTDSVYDTEKLSERIAKLAGGVAVIKVGAATETELEDRKLRIEDAKNATFSAVEEGITPGGGATMAHLARMVPDIKATLADEEERLGADIVMKGLIGPLTLIAENAGVEGAVVVDRVQEEDWEMGYNAMDDEYVNMLDAGVIDPAKVTRCALENASSIAGMVLTTQAVMCEDAPAAAAAPTLNGMTGMPGM